MAKFSITQFGGIFPKIPARYLPDTAAQIAINAGSQGTSLQPHPGVGDAVHTIPHDGTLHKTIYRWGQNSAAENLYWMAWQGAEDVARAQIPGDQNEWTFFTQKDKPPIATYKDKAIGSSIDPAQKYPLATVPLGLPAYLPPDGVNATDTIKDSYRPKVSIGPEPELSGDTNKVTLSSTLLEQIDTNFALTYTINEGTPVSVSLAANTAIIVAAALDAETDLTAEVVDGSVVVETTTDDDYLEIEITTGIVADTASAFTYGSVNNYGPGSEEDKPFIVITDDEIASMVGRKISLKSDTYTYTQDFVVEQIYDPQTVADAFNGVFATESPQRWQALKIGNQVLVLSTTSGGNYAGSYIEYSRTGKGKTLQVRNSPYLRFDQSVLQIWTNTKVTFTADDGTTHTDNIRNQNDRFVEGFNNAFAGKWKMEWWVAANGINEIHIFSLAQNKSAAEKMTVTYKAYDPTANGGDGGTVTVTVETKSPVALAADNEPFLRIGPAELASLGVDDKDLYVYSNTKPYISAKKYTGSTVTASSLASDLNTAFAGEWVASVDSLGTYGSGVIIKAGTAPIDNNSRITYETTESSLVATTIRDDYRDAQAPVRVIVTNDEFTDITSEFPINYLEITVNANQPYYYAIPSGVTDFSSLQVLESKGFNVTIYGNAEPFALVESPSVGPTSTLRIRNGTYANSVPNTITVGPQLVEDFGVKETRIYAWTWVADIASFEFESAPSLPSDPVDVYPKQSTTITNLPSAMTGYDVAYKRLYRAVNGVYLFVKEVPATDTTITDDVLNEELGEELPSLTWKEPPKGLQGLINHPGGFLAGFKGNDVYFSEVYRPHAWPENYVITVDNPVVGLGRMDTTLVVLTTGSPYFIQGSTPDALAVVKSDIQQSCVSKRSIVSINGAVIYASPDGLVALSSSGSRILTQDYFTKEQWQSIKPETIHAYPYDSKYVAFTDYGTPKTGFVYDLTSAQMIYNQMPTLPDGTARYVVTAHSDPIKDTLYVLLNDGKIYKWASDFTLNQTGVFPYTWKSKKFSAPAPLAFTCANVDAESYPINTTIYADGVAIHTEAVASREPFRLPAVRARDWEIELSGVSEVFSASIAQSPAELANG